MSNFKLELLAQFHRNIQLHSECHFPLEFMVAVINNFGGFYSTEFYIHEARRYGAIIEAPEINESEYLTRIEDHIIWLGWIHIKALESRTIEQLLFERSRNDFISFFHFFQRVPVGLEQLIILIRVGAFRNLGIPKKELLWEAHLLCNNPNKPKPQTIALFGSPEPMQFQFPVLKHYSIKDAYDQIELLGFPICSPFLLIKENYLQSICSDALLENVGKRITIYGYLVTYKRITTKTNKPQVFGYFADYKGEYFDTTHFSNSLLKYPFKGKGIYCMYGKVVEQFGFPSIEVYSMRKVEVRADPRSLEISPVLVSEITE